MAGTVQPGQIRVVAMRPHDAARVVAVDRSAFFFDRGDQTPEQVTAALDWDRAFAATSDPPSAEPGSETLLGVYGWLDMTLTVPAGGADLQTLPMAGVTWVGVDQDHRRRGVLTAMMTHHLNAMHEAGRPLSGLHASEPTIYGRFGYAVASSVASLELPRGATLHAVAFGAAAEQVRTTAFLADSADVAATIEDVQHRSAEAALGSVGRSPGLTRAALYDVPSTRRGREPMWAMFAGEPGRYTGYALFSREDKWSDGQPRGKVTVHEIGGVDSPSLLALARRMLDFDLTSQVFWQARSVDDPICWWAGGPRAAGQRVYDGLWLRLVEVDAALAQRGYTGACDVVLDVVDEQCPWNSRRWRLETDEAGSARCSRTRARADLRVPVATLGAAYLGARSILALHQMGYLEERTNGAAAALSAAMRSDLPAAAPIEF